MSNVAQFDPEKRHRQGDQLFLEGQERRHNTLLRAAPLMCNKIRELDPDTAAAAEATLNPDAPAELQMAEGRPNLRLVSSMMETPAPAAAPLSEAPVVAAAPVERPHLQLVPNVVETPATPAPAYGQPISQLDDARRAVAAIHAPTAVDSVDDNLAAMNYGQVIDESFGVYEDAA